MIRCPAAQTIPGGMARGTGEKKRDLWERGTMPLPVVRSGRMENRRVWAGK